MGEIIVEETGEVPVCMFCGSSEGCSHLVAGIDRSFGECCGGVLFENIERFRERLSAYLLQYIRAGKPLELLTTDYDIREIAEEAKSNLDPNYPDDLYIDDYMLLSSLIELLSDCGAEEAEGYIVEESGPGQSSALTLLYANDPARVIKSAEDKLAKLLRKQSQS